MKAYLRHLAPALGQGHDLQQFLIHAPVLKKGSQLRGSKITL